MTYMGKLYYPLWLDNLADDVTLEAAAMDGTAHGADAALDRAQSPRTVYGAPGVQLRRPVRRKQFPRGLFELSSRHGHLRRRALVTFNADGQTQHIVVNHRPRSAMLQFSRGMLETFYGTPHAKHWGRHPVQGATGGGDMASTYTRQALLSRMGGQPCRRRNRRGAGVGRRHPGRGGCA